MLLHEISVDQLLVELEKRQEAYAQAKAEFDHAQMRLDVMFSQQYGAIRNAQKISVEDAKHAVRGRPGYESAWSVVLDLQRVRDEAMLSLERMRTAIDLWRTEQATIRKAG